MATASSQDTEITLGTGKMLALFFGLVALCAVFFGLGFSLGKNSVSGSVATVSVGPTTVNGGPRPSAVKPTSTNQADLTFYKAVEKKDADSQLTTADSTSPAAAVNPAPAAPSSATPSPANPGETKPPTLDQAAAPASGGYFVQVAAVSKPEDAEALVEALKNKQYPAFSATAPTDKLFHVQVGPFADVKDAESMRAKLLSDGYNPILKK
jgi:DedD protein